MSKEDTKITNEQPLVSQQRKEFLAKIRSTTEQLLPEVGAEVVFTVGMAGSIKDILLTTPLAEAATIVAVDAAPFKSGDNGQVNDIAIEDAKKIYLSAYSGKDKSNSYLESRDRDNRLRNLGIETMLEWEFEELGVTVNAVSEEDSVYRYSLDYQGKSFNLVYVNKHIPTDEDLDSLLPDDINELVYQGNGVDAVVLKATDGLATSPSVLKYINGSSSENCVILSDVNLDAAFSKNVRNVMFDRVDANINSTEHFGYDLDVDGVSRNIEFYTNKSNPNNVRKRRPFLSLRNPFKN